MKTSKINKVLIIGGGGFIGSWLTKYFLKLGNKVIIIDPLNNHSGIEKDFLDKIIHFRKKYLLGNSTTFFEDFREVGDDVVKKFSPDIVINLAAIPIEGSKDQSLPRKQIVDDTDLSEQIVTSVKRNKVPKFIYLSSIFAYGDIDDWSTTEKNKLHPKTPYGISKAIGELITKAYLDNWNIIRTTSVYGFGDANLRVAQVFINNALNKKPFWVNKDALLDFTYVKDLVTGIIKISTSDLFKEDFHISGGGAVLLPELVKELEKHFPKLKYEIKGEPNDRPQRGSMDITKARILLNWKPSYSLEKGIKDYIKLVRKFGHG